MSIHLLPFNNFHKGETVLLLGPGPSLNNFKDNFGDNIKRACVNGVIIHPEFIDKLDYYIWSGDIDCSVHPQPGYHYIMNSIPKLKKDTIKFVNCWTDNSITGLFNTQTQLHPSTADKLGFIKYNQLHKNTPQNGWMKDIGHVTSGVSSYSVAFQAMQILLYMGFTQFILVGFDCGGKSHSYKKYDECANDVCEWDDELSSSLIKQWIEFKKWINNEYTDIDIKVVNPYGLKNVFEEY